jgi:hypothetical protein
MWVSLIFESFCCLSTSVSLLATGSSNFQVLAVIDGDFYYFVVSFIIYIGSFYILVMIFDVNKIYTLYILCVPVIQTDSFNSRNRVGIIPCLHLMTETDPLSKTGQKRTGFGACQTAYPVV